MLLLLLKRKGTLKTKIYNKNNITNEKQTFFQNFEIRKHLNKNNQTY